MHYVWIAGASPIASETSSVLSDFELEEEKTRRAESDNGPLSGLGGIPCLRSAASVSWHTENSSRIEGLK